MKVTLTRRRPRRRTNRTTGWALLAVVAGGVGVAAPAPAWAYVRYHAADGSGYAWAESCVHITGYPNDFPDMTADQVLTAVTDAAGAWTKESQACTYLTIDVGLSSNPTPKARRDFANSLIFRHADWCSPNDPAWRCSYDEAALAITTVFTDGRDGRIQDADIEVNDRWFSWGDLMTTPDTTGSKQDLQNALTHEMGHLIGLDHTCYTPTAANNIAPIDNTGNPVPTCSGAPAKVRATTMFASAIAGDLTKRTLEPDDQQAVCDIYPLASDPVSCPASLAPPGGRGCVVAGGAGDDRPGWAALGATALLAAMLTVGRRRRGGRPR